MATLVFGFLCGILYLIGLLFGRSYEQISIDICIYACPVICIVYAFLTGWVYSNSWSGRIGKAFNYSLGLIYILIARFFWNHYSGPTHYVFSLCMNDLKSIAKSLGCSYEQINLYIYCHLFFGIVLFHLLQVFLIKWRRKRIIPNRLNS